MIISEKQIMQLLQSIQTLAFRYAEEGKQEESARMLSWLKEIADQQSEELKVIE